MLIFKIKKKKFRLRVCIYIFVSIVIRKTRNSKHRRGNAKYFYRARSLFAQTFRCAGRTSKLRKRDNNSRVQEQLFADRNRWKTAAIGTYLGHQSREMSSGNKSVSTIYISLSSHPLNYSSSRCVHEYTREFQPVREIKRLLLVHARSGRKYRGERERKKKKKKKKEKEKRREKKTK